MVADDEHRPLLGQPIEASDLGTEVLRVGLEQWPDAPQEVGVAPAAGLITSRHLPILCALVRLMGLLQIWVLAIW